MKNILLILFGVLFLASCGKKQEIPNTKTDSKTETNVSNDLSSKGKEIFYLQSNLTGLKCADCHSDGTNTQNTNTKYFSNVIGANKRTSVFNGMFTGDDVKKNASGGKYCWDTFLKMGREISQEEIDALNSYFNSLSKGDEKNDVYTTLAVPVPDKAKLKDNQTKIAGMTPNIQNGEKVFKETCGFCHGGKTVKRVPSLFEEFEGNLKSIVYHIRMGAKFMPFYTFEKISDQDAADITEYIMKNQKK